MQALYGRLVQVSGPHEDARIVMPASIQMRPETTLQPDGRRRLSRRYENITPMMETDVDQPGRWLVEYRDLRAAGVPVIRDRDRANAEVSVFFEMDAMKHSCTAIAVFCVGLLSGLSGCDSGATTHVPRSQGTAAAGQALPANVLPRPEHVVIVIEENKAYSQIIDNKEAPFLNRLARDSALFTQSYGIRHPSEPNYLALFSGSTQGLTDDSCPHHYASANLAQALAEAGHSLTIYSEGLPHIGDKVCRSGHYARKHNPAADWQGANVSPQQNQPFSSFPKNFNDLPTVSLVIPDQIHDMHSASIGQGDHWLENNLSRYAQWAQQHDSLLIVTWDEDNGKHDNRIATLFAGAMVKSGQYDRKINHYNVLRTLEDMYGLPRLGKSAQATPITSIWNDAR